MDTPATPASPLTVYLDGLTPSSRVTMKDALETIALFFDPKSSASAFPWHTLRYEQSQSLRSFLVEKGYKARTINRMIAAFRGVLKACWRVGLITTDEYHHTRDVKLVRVSEPPAGRRLSMGELRKLVYAGDDKRDAALVAMLYAGGCRRFEVAKLRYSDYDRDSGAVTIRGKGGKTRQVTVHEDFREIIEAWMEEYKPRADAPLFPRERAGKYGGRLSVSGVAYIVETRRKLAGVAPFSTHDMRRTFLTNLLDSGADLPVVQRIAGHENVNTTAGYDRRTRAAEDEAIKKLPGLKPTKP